MVETIKKTKFAWAFYDWANSVFPLVMTAAIFPAYYVASTESAFGSSMISFSHFSLKNSVVYEYTMALSFLMVALIFPLLSGIADTGGHKKSFLKIFVWIGSLSTALLFFFTGDNIFAAMLLFLIANIGFNGSLVFYNSYLPEIASKKEIDALSAKGYSLGYAGSVILLLICLIFITFSEKINIDRALATRTSFLAVGLWWIGFSQYSFKYLPSDPKKHHITKNNLRTGYHEIKKVWRIILKDKTALQYLLSFFFISMGIQTVIYVASLFGSSELHLNTGFLIISILLIQIVAILGAILFAKISSKFGNINSLLMTIAIWIVVCLAAHFIHNKIEFLILAALVGLVMGGSQSLARASFAKIIPDKTKDTASFFSFYKFSEMIAIVIGMFSYGTIESISGNMRNSVIVLAVFFLTGALIMLPIRKDQRLRTNK